jgi:hypothetical protein
MRAADKIEDFNIVRNDEHYGCMKEVLARLLQ